MIRKSKSREEIVQTSSNEKAIAPSSLSMDLFSPGMTAMHRAGLGGLACSLRYIELRVQKKRDISKSEIPGGPWIDNKPPWSIESDRITLDFGEPESAAEFLKRLFAMSFQILEADGAIYLPGQYQYRPTPSLAVLSDSQTAATLTFLQHGQTRKLVAKAELKTIDLEEDGSKPMSIEFKRCFSYKHQQGWESLCDKKGCITNKPIEVVGPLNPGAVVRHVAFTSTTKIEEPINRVLPLYFAIVGTLALSVNRGVGVLIVPEVTDLVEFTKLRPLMSPSTARDCQIAGASDAAFQCQLRLRASKEIETSRIPSCTALLFRSTPWASQQKSRVEAIEVRGGDEEALEIFQHAIDCLPPRTATTISPKDSRVAKKSAVKKTFKKPKVLSDPSSKPKEYFWSDSIVRPLVADNLAKGQPWYCGFRELMTKSDPVSKKPKRLKLNFEKKGLKKMIDEVPWNDQGEKAIVQAVHQAMRQRFGQIAKENKGKTGTMKNRMNGEFDKWRLAFSGSKTQNQFRSCLCDLFSRAGINPVLREHWASVLPWLSDTSRWELVRDLSLLALASYTGTGTKELESEEQAESEITD